MTKAHNCEDCTQPVPCVECPELKSALVGGPEGDLLGGVYLGDMLTEPCQRAQRLLVKNHFELAGKTISVAMRGNYQTNLLRFTDGTWAALGEDDLPTYLMNGDLQNAMYLGLIEEDEYCAEMNAQADAMSSLCITHTNNDA